MIVVTGHMNIQSAKRDEAITAMKAVMEATRAESGNVEYTFAADVSNPDRFVLVEQWQDQEAMDHHMATDHLATFLQASADLVGGDVSVVRHDVSESSKLF